MNGYNGEERRISMFDKGFYDKMMQVHSDMTYLRKWAQDHDLNDSIVHEKLDVRIKNLENDKMKIIGAAGALGAVGGFLSKWLFK